MTTNTTNSQDRPMNLGELLDAYKAAILNGIGSTAQRGAIEDHFAFELGIAKTAYGAEKARADEAEEWLETEKAFSHSQEKERIVAETRLAEIQRGVEGLKNPYLNRLESDMGCGFARCRDDVIALLQPQGQADTSGLPG